MRLAPEDRQASLLIASGTFMIAAALTCWWFGIDWRLHYNLHLSPSLAPLFVRLSALGGAAIMIPIGFVGLAFLVAQKRRADAAWLFLTLAIGRLGIEGIKLVLSRPRPPVEDWLDHVTSSSFPSSHSAGTMMTCVALALLLEGGDGAILVALLAALFIGWTRVALGVHWPSDVMAGWGIGLVWIGLAMSVRNAIAPTEPEEGPPATDPNQAQS